MFDLENTTYPDGFRPDQPGPDDESRYACPDIRHNKLHLPWFEGFADGERSIYRDTLQRPAFFRTESLPSGINGSARHVIGEESTACPYCRQRFRNPSALKLHVEQAHSAEFEWLFAERPTLSLDQQLSQLNIWAENEPSDEEQRLFDEHIAREKLAMQDKHLRDLLEGKLDYTDFL